MGGDSVRSFVFGLIVGIAIGTYSSIFVSGAITFDALRKVDIIEEDKKKFDYKGSKKKESIEVEKVNEIETE
jgi:preprotein translocase subunit SecF